MDEEKFVDTLYDSLKDSYPDCKESIKEQIKIIKKGNPPTNVIGSFIHFDVIRFFKLGEKRSHL
jgi:hypothetical protein